MKNKKNRILTKRFLRRQISHLGYSLLIGVFLSILLGGPGTWQSSDTLLSMSLYSLVIGFTLWKSNEFVSLVIDYFFPPYESPKKNLLWNFAGSLFISVLTIFLVNLLAYRWFFGVNILLEYQVFMIAGVVQLFIALLITSISHLVSFFNAWTRSTLNEERLRHEALRLEYEALKSYINPHFLFNSLSILSSLIDVDPGRSQKFLKQLSDIYRYVLEHKDSEIVPLADELGFVRSFIDLHRIRHGDNLEVNIDADNSSGYIIPLSLQILLENCFKHNIISEEFPLFVSIWRSNGYIHVRNNLQKRRTIAETGGMGLDMITKRYALLTDKAVKIVNNKLDFIVGIPVIDSAEKPDPRLPDKGPAINGN